MGLRRASLQKGGCKKKKKKIRDGTKCKRNITKQSRGCWGTDGGAAGSPGSPQSLRGTEQPDTAAGSTWPGRLGKHTACAPCLLAQGRGVGAPLELSTQCLARHSFRGPSSANLGTTAVAVADFLRTWSKRIDSPSLCKLEANIHHQPW